MLNGSNRQRQNRLSEETESTNKRPIYSDYGSDHDLEEPE